MLPASQSDISTTNSFSLRVACDKLGLSVKGAGKITLVILTEGCATELLSFTPFRQFATLTDTFPKGQASLIAFL